MAAFAYLLLPLTGLIAFLTGRDQRVRTHGLQAIAVGLLWPVCLYAASLGPPVAVQLTFGAGAIVWLGLLLLTMFGRDPMLPVVGDVLAGYAETSTKDYAGTGSKDEPRSTSGS